MDRLNQSEAAALFKLRDPKTIRNWGKKRGFPRPVLQNGPRVEYEVEALAEFSVRTKTPICLETARLYKIPSSLLARFYHVGVDGGAGAEVPGAFAIRGRIAEELRGVCAGKYHCVPPLMQRGLEGLVGNDALMDALASLIHAGHRDSGSGR